MPDIFDRIKLDIFDRTDLPDEEKVIFNPEMAKLIQEELNKAIEKIPIGKMIAQIIRREMTKSLEQQKSLKDNLSDEVRESKAATDKKLASIKSEIQEFMEKMRKKYDELKTEVRQPRYEFGGYPLSGGGLPFANWRFRESGTELVIETLVNDVWVESSAFLRPE